MKKIIFALLALILFFGCTQQVQQPQNSGQQTQQIELAIKVFDGNQFLVDKKIDAQKGINGLDALKIATNVLTAQSSFGEFVTSLEGVTADQKHYWALYVNGVYAEKGIDQYSFEENTLIEWKLEEIRAI